MTRYLLALVVLAGFPRGLAAQDAKAVLETAAAAIGATQLTSVEISGRGSDFLFGQAYDGDSPWPRFNVPRYTLTIDFTVPALRDDRIREQGQNPPFGGGNQPLVGEQRQVWSVRGTHAWNGENGGAAGNERDGRSAVEGRLAQVWLTPHGFIKGAMAGNATVKTEVFGQATRTMVSFTAPTGAVFDGVIDQHGLIQRIETRLASPVLGDTIFDAVFSDYRQFGTVKFPTHIVQHEGGYPVLDLTVTDVKANQGGPIEVPANVRARQPQTARPVEPQRLADRVWAIPLGTRDRSVAIEIGDYILVVEAPDSEEQSMAAIQAITRAIPGKPIRYIVNTHTHFDHAGGLRTYVAEGAAVVTHRDNIDYYRQVWAAPRSIAPDRLAKTGGTPVFEGVAGSRTFADATHEAVVYHYAGNQHNPGMLMVFLPQERILIQADSFNAPNNPGGRPTAIPNLVQFLQVVDRLGLDVDQLVGLHDRITTLTEARAAAATYGNAK